MPGGRPLKFQTVEELQLKIDDYFAVTPKEEWTITGLACHLDTDRVTLMVYEGRTEFTNTVKTAKNRIEAEYEKRGWNGKTPAFAIFALKNFDWTDKSSQELSGPNGTAIVPTVNIIGYKPLTPPDVTT